MEKNRQAETVNRPMDRRAVLNMEKCASFLARMIQKYGQEVLAEIEAEKNRK